MLGQIAGWVSIISFSVFSIALFFMAVIWVIEKLGMRKRRQGVEIEKVEEAGTEKMPWQQQLEKNWKERDAARAANPPMKRMAEVEKALNKAGYLIVDFTFKGSGQYQLNIERNSVINQGN